MAALSGAHEPPPQWLNIRLRREGRRKPGSEAAREASPARSLARDASVLFWYEEGLLAPRLLVVRVQSDWKGLSDYGTVGLDIVLSILVGFFAGRWLDGKLGTHGWLSILGFALGTAAGFRSLYRAAVKMRKQAEAEDERERQNQAQDERHRPE
jgi:F0F1-type ATP synthase assembly protein I